MKPVLASIFLANLVLAPAAGRAQDRETAPDAHERLKPYVAPPAPKSVEVADFYLRRKKYNAALSRYLEAVKTDPYCAPAYLGLGKVYEKMGLKRKALINFQKYLDLLPSTKDAEEATGVQRAVARLEHDLKAPKAPQRIRRSRPEPQ